VPSKARSVAADKLVKDRETQHTSTTSCWCRLEEKMICCWAVGPPAGRAAADDLVRGTAGTRDVHETRGMNSAAEFQNKCRFRGPSEPPSHRSMVRRQRLSGSDKLSQQVTAVHNSSQTELKIAVIALVSHRAIQEPSACYFFSEHNHSTVTASSRKCTTY